MIVNKNKYRKIGFFYIDVMRHKMPCIFLGGVVLIFATSLVFLPISWLIPWQIVMRWGIGIFLVGTLFIRVFYSTSSLRMILLKWGGIWLLCCGVLGYIHHEARTMYQLAMANNYLPNKIKTHFFIEKILAQHHYQRVVVKATLPNHVSPQFIYLNWYVNKPVQVGEHWYGELSLRPLTARLNTGGMDKQKWFFSQGITAMGKVKRAIKIKPNEQWRGILLQRALQKTAGLSQQGLLLALGFGERAWLLPKDKQIYQKTNTAHLIAISGLHIGLAMLLGIWVAKIGQLILPTRWISPYFPMFLGLVFACFYAFLAGFSIPTLRAIVALLVVMLGQQMRLFWNKWQYFVWVLGGLLFFDPLMVLSDSFWLSVGAVLSLMVWYQFVPFSQIKWRDKPLNHFPWFWRYFLGLFHLQIGLLWLFTPIQLALFSGISLYSLWANLLLVPLFSLVIVPLVLLATLFNQAMLWQMANIILEKIVYLLLPLQSGWWVVSEREMWGINFACLCSFGLFLFILQYKKIATPRFLQRLFPLSLSVDPSINVYVFYRAYMIMLGFFCVIWGKILCHMYSPFIWRVTMLDVGQGLAMLIEKNGHGVLYDTGGAWGRGENTNTMATLEILPYLQRSGLQLDEIILSHDDLDHAGGIKVMHFAYPKARLTSPSKQNDALNAPIFASTFPKKRKCVKGMAWQWQGLQFQVFSPNKVVDKAKNDDSCVLLISDNTHRLLLMGDASWKVERRLIQDLPKVDVLQLGHHGSKTSSQWDFLKHTSPKIALVSAGRWNQWGLPSKVVMERLYAQHIPMWNTAQYGSIEVRFLANGIQIYPARHRNVPWYQSFIGIERENR